MQAYNATVTSPTRHLVTRDGELPRSHGDWFARHGEGMFLRAPWSSFASHDYLRWIVDTDIFLITASGATFSQLRAVHVDVPITEKDRAELLESLRPTAATEDDA